MATAIASAVVSAIGLTGTAATIASIGVQLAVAYGVQSLTKPSSPSSDASPQSREMTMTGGETPERIIYGRAKVGGTLYMLQKYKDYIYHGIALCRHPIQEIEAVYFDNKPLSDPDWSNVELAIYTLSFGGTVGSGDISITVEGVTKTHTNQESEGLDSVAQAFASAFNSEPALNDFVFSKSGTVLKIERQSGSMEQWDIAISVNPRNTGITIDIAKEKGSPESEKYYRIIIETGTQTAANSTLVSELDFPDVTHRWTSSHKLIGIPHINVRWDAKYLRDKIGHIPEITVVLKGKSTIYDPRTGTTGYTDNAALCLRDFLSNPCTFKATPAQLPNAIWNAAANLCDETIDLGTHGSQKRYAVNTVLEINPGSDLLRLFADAMQAPVLWSGGQWVIRPAAYRIPTIELTVDELSGNIQYTDRPSIQDRYNTIQGTFINPDQEWSAHDYPSISVDDGLGEKIGNLSFTTEIDPWRAQRLAQLNLLLNYSGAPVRIPIKRLTEYISADIMIYLTVPVLNWNRKSFYVASRDDQSDSTAVLTLLARDPFMYEWDISNAQDVDTVTAEPIFKIRENIV